MQIIIDGIDLVEVVEKSIYEYKDYGFAILGFYGGTIFYKYFFVGKKYYQGSKFFQNKKDCEIKKLKSEIEFLKKNSEQKNKEKDFKKQRIELDFEKKLPSKEKVYEIVKNIYSELQNTKVSKTFNLTEAVFMLRNMDEFNFFTKENGRIMFEKKIELIDDEEYEDKNSMRNHIDDFSELEIKELVKSFQLPKENEEEMLVAVLSGSSYIYQIVHGLNCIFTNDMVRFIRDGNKTISEDWAEIDMIHPYTELYSLVEKRDDNGKKVLTAVKKTSKKAKEARKENEALNQNIEDLEKDEADDRFEDNSLPVENDLEFTEEDKQIKESNFQKIEDDQVEEIVEPKKQMVFDFKDPSFLDFFKKKYWINTTEEFEKDIFKTLFKNYIPKIDCVFYKTNSKTFHLYIDVELFALLIDRVIHIDKFEIKFYRKNTRKEKTFIYSSILNEEVFNSLDFIIKDNFKSVSLGKNTEDEKISIKYYVKKGNAFYTTVCYKIKITKEILDEILTVVDIPFYSKDKFISEYREDIDEIISSDIKVYDRYEKFPLISSIEE